MVGEKHAYFVLNVRCSGLSVICIAIEKVRWVLK